jgi:hypothetical protein
MKSCPECGATLNEGVVTVKGPTPQFFIPLFADQHLWFIDMEDVTKRIAARLEKRHGKNRN